MGRNSGDRSKRKVAKWTAADMHRAVHMHVYEKVGVRKSAKICNIPHSTLISYIKKYKDDKTIAMEPNYKTNKVFTNEQELQLKDYLIDCAQKFYGVTKNNCLKIVYQMAEKNGIAHPSTWEKNKKAGRDWWRSFKSRHPELSIKKPEACSLARATAFNEYNVKKFFENLKTVIKRQSCFEDGTRIYNLDETATSTVQRPQKVIGIKGQNLLKVTSAERGVLVTTCCIVNALGQALPPAMVFPRKKFQQHMIKGAPTGTLGLAAPSGWMNSELFVLVMKHFIKHVAASHENPALLIMDNHESHLSIQALDLAKDSGVTILTLHPHTTAKMQPLDVGLNAPFKAFYNAAVDSWLLRNPGKPLTIYDVAECVGIAYPKAMTPVNICQAFKKCGIFPYDDEIFTELDFLPSSVTDRPPNEEPLEFQEIQDTTEIRLSPNILETCHLNNNVANIVDNGNQGSAGTSKSFLSPRDFMGPLKAGPRKKTYSRKRGKSIIATDTPEKEEISKKKTKIELQKKQKITKVTQRLFKNKNSVQNNDTDSSDGEFKASGSSSGGEQILSCLSDSEDEEHILTNDFLPLLRQPKASDYVIVEFTSKKTKLYYIALVLEEIDGEFDFFVSYLKLKSKVLETFVDPIMPDSAGVKLQDIKYILPSPIIKGSSRRNSTLKFPVNMQLINFPY